MRHKNVIDEILENIEPELLQAEEGTPLYERLEAAIAEAVQGYSERTQARVWSAFRKNRFADVDSHERNTEGVGIYIEEDESNPDLRQSNAHRSIRIRRRNSDDDYSGPGNEPW